MTRSLAALEFLLLFIVEEQSKVVEEGQSVSEVEVVLDFMKVVELF